MWEAPAEGQPQSQRNGRGFRIGRAWASPGINAFSEQALLTFSDTQGPLEFRDTQGPIAPEIFISLEVCK